MSPLVNQLSGEYTCRLQVLEVTGASCERHAFMNCLHLLYNDNTEMYVRYSHGYYRQPGVPSPQALRYIADGHCASAIHAYTHTLCCVTYCCYTRSLTHTACGDPLGALRCNISYPLSVYKGPILCTVRVRFPCPHWSFDCQVNTRAGYRCSR